VVEFGEQVTMSMWDSIPDTVSKRQFPETGKWEAVQVFDSDWGREVPGLVDPYGNLDYVYDGFARFAEAQAQAERHNTRR
jgi:hypothetical protein